MEKVKGLRNEKAPQTQTRAWGRPEGKGVGRWKKVKGVTGDGRRPDLGW